MSLDTSIWGKWVDIPIEEIAQGSKINDDDSGFLSDLINNQEILREVQVNTKFDEVNTSSATYVTLVTRPLWIPAWCKQPGSGKLSDLVLDVALQVYVTGGGSADVGVRTNVTWWGTTGITSASYGAPTRLAIFASDGWAASYGSEVTLEVRARTSAGTVYVRDVSGCSMIRKVAV